MGGLTETQVDFRDEDGNGLAIQLVDGASLTGAKLSVVVPGSASIAANGLMVFGLDPSNNAKTLSFDASGNLKIALTGAGSTEQHIVDLGSDLYATGVTKGVLALSRVISAAPSLTNAQFSATTLDLAGNLRTADRDRHAELDTVIAAQGCGVLGSDGSVFRWLKIDTNGSLVIAAAPTANTFFRFGDVVSAAISQLAVRRTTYTEQTTDAQRSIASSSANDTGAGTGARTVRITYYTSAGVGPLTETVTLTGVAYVNTVNTNICYIESLEVMTVGNGSNVGIITLKAGLAGAGATIGTIAATDNRTFWAHHYVPSGVTFKLTGISCGHNGTVVDSGAMFILKSLPIGVANVPEAQISDFVKLYGQSSTFARAYNSPIKVVGPARIIMYVTSESDSTFTYRGAFDFFEE